MIWGGHRGSRRSLTRRGMTFRDSLYACVATCSCHDRRTLGKVQGCGGRQRTYDDTHSELQTACDGEERSLFDPRNDEEVEVKK